jgi:hypothetical protein
MVTTKNIHEKTFNSDGEEKLLLDELMLTPHHVGHVSIVHGTMLIYVHEQTRCYNICENETGVKLNYNKMFEAKMMSANEIAKGGKSHAC